MDTISPTIVSKPDERVEAFIARLLAMTTTGPIAGSYNGKYIVVRPGEDVDQIIAKYFSSSPVSC